MVLNLLRRLPALHHRQLRYGFPEQPLHNHPSEQKLHIRSEDLPLFLPLQTVPVPYGRSVQDILQALFLILRYLFGIKEQIPVR